MRIGRILPEFTWIKTKYGITGTIVEVHEDSKKF